MCGLYFAGSCFDPATAAFLAVAAATASTTTTTVPCPWAHSLVCVRCRTCWARKTRKSWKKYRRATKNQTNNVSTGGGRMVQCTTCAVWQEYATEFYKKDKRQYESTGKITCGTCRRLQCKSKLTGLPPPAAMATTRIPPSAMATRLPPSAARENSPYYAYAPPAYYSGAVGPQRTQTQNTPSPFLGHHPEHTNNYYYYQHQQQPQSLPAAPVYDHYYAPAPSYRHNEQMPTTMTTTQSSLHRNPDEREEEEGGGGWNAATTQLQQQQQSRHNVTRTE